MVNAAQASYSYSADFSGAFSNVSGAPQQTLLDQLKLFLGIPIEDDQFDEALTRALNQAGDTLEKYLDRIIVKRETIEHYPHHFGTVVLHEPQVDPTANLTVYLNGVVQSGYDIYMMRGKVAHLTRIGHSLDVPMDWRIYDQVDVTYTAGYDPIPSDLAYAITLYASLLYTAEGTGSIPSAGGGDIKQFQLYDVGTVSYDTGSSASTGGGSGGSTIQAGMIPAEVAQSVQFYKRMSC